MILTSRTLSLQMVHQIHTRTIIELIERPPLDEPRSEHSGVLLNYGWLQRLQEAFLVTGKEAGQCASHFIFTDPILYIKDVRLVSLVAAASIINI